MPRVHGCAGHPPQWNFASRWGSSLNMAQRTGRRGGYRDRDTPQRRDHNGLRQHVRAIGGSSYGRYKSLTGTWEFPRFSLRVVRVQPDPFAPASRLEVRVGPDVAGFPADLWSSRVRARALADFLLRCVNREVADSRLRVDAGGQQVLTRSACQVTEDGAIVLRLAVDLPGRGRTIDGAQAEAALCRDLPAAVEAGLSWQTADHAVLREFVDSVQDTDALRRALADRGLVAFVADGAMLARRSGVDDRPLMEGVPFESTDSLRVQLDVPNRGRVSGMGVPEGVTLVVGGGFHGKSTLLRALERGIYDHVPGDGRELVVCRPDTVKIRAEDGRPVHRVDVSPFVSHLPSGADTADFSTSNASGSTSQAASIVEAVEAGARVLLVDEDTAATNLMIRDARMQALVAKESEPLTPFVDLVRPLYRDQGVSTVLVMGGSGDYLDVADLVLMMDAYRAREVTTHARQVAADPTGRHAEAARFPAVRHRIPAPGFAETRRPKVRARGVDALTLGESTVELRGVEQLVDTGQVTGIGLALVTCARAGLLDGQRSLADVLELFAARADESGVLAVDEGYPGDFVLPRTFELAAALNRLRTLRVVDFHP